MRRRGRQRLRSRSRWEKNCATYVKRGTLVGDEGGRGGWLHRGGNGGQNCKLRRGEINIRNS